MIRLVVDSTFDFSNEFISSHDIDVVPLSVQFGTCSYKEKIDLTTEEFYQKMAASSELPKTSQPAPQLWLAVFTKAVETKDQLIVMTLSSGLSGTYQSACMAAELCSDAQIEIIDTKNVTLGAQVQALEVLRMIDEGLSFEEIVTKAREGGRLSKVEGAVGSLIAIKPFISVDEEGKLITLSKSRGLRKGISTMVDTMKNDDIDTSKPMVSGYTYTNESLNQFMSACDDERFIPEMTSNIGAVVGTHAGVNGCAAAYFVK